MPKVLIEAINVNGNGNSIAGVRRVGNINAESADDEVVIRNSEFTGDNNKVAGVHEEAAAVHPRSAKHRQELYDKLKPLADSGSLIMVEGADYYSCSSSLSDVMKEAIPALGIKGKTDVVSDDVLREIIRKRDGSLYDESAIRKARRDSINADGK